MKFLQSVSLYSITQDHEVFMQIPCGWDKEGSRQSVIAQNDTYVWPLFSIVATQTRFGMMYFCTHWIKYVQCLGFYYPAELKWIRAARLLPHVHQVPGKHGHRQGGADAAISIVEILLTFHTWNWRELVPPTFSVCRVRGTIMYVYVVGASQGESALDKVRAVDLETR